MSTNVVDFQEIEPGIVHIKMQDRAHKNTFSRALIHELIQVFKHIETSDQYKAVILTGYDSYFATGGTQEDLFALQEGKGKFTDTNIYSLPLECPIPVISAMQGHAVGGGLVMGLFADFVIMSQESIYTANFMKYGFTPGMGGTLIVPEKLGLALGQEMLMLGNNYRGEALKQRGIPFPVYPREQVADAALSIARDLVKKPRTSLITLKDHLTQSLRTKLPEYTAQEVIMHEKTFFQQEVRQNISRLFGN
ncbi:polyketide synthase [Dickeya dianthicola]|uniref:polyketide synthase n=1 Tax=Dickeya dianthicola TaxID=204039 RepID=UPI00039A3940|nr:polyketide synthase [Dickeya dianthicola]MCI4030710.1 polyketide synthase [Dickeya dianthicola]MCI4173393.1 polyketide synthase [Dickeya dianthicola]MCI4175762.1 polyketide synthase [Dickeya dianthicola]MCI4183063.1 polyketide synthase [Dickeya dianthicola]MCI4193226.1 polyketide synthase [Dickeya dianthicola]